MIRELFATLKNTKNMYLRHSVLGEGQIIQVEMVDDKVILTVRFNNGEVKRFVAPSIFLGNQKNNAKLVTDNFEVNVILDKYKASITCEICLEIDKKISIINNKKICFNCSALFKECKSCGVKFLKATDSNYNYCEKCFEKNTKNCSYCGQISELDRGKASPYVYDGSFICNPCLYMHFQIDNCDGCRAEIDSNHRTYIDKASSKKKYLLCPECLQNHTVECKACGQVIYSTEHESKEINCYECQSKIDYEKYISGLSIFSEKCHIYNFEQLNARKSVPLMTRLRKQYSDSGLQIHGSHIDFLVITELTYRRYDKSFDKYKVYNVIADIDIRKFETSSKSFLISDIRSKKEFYRLSIQENIKSVQLSGGQIFYYFSSPIVVRGMTNFEQDYGTRWYGQYYYEQGNYFGDTYSFAYIGYFLVELSDVSEFEKQFRKVNQA